MIDPTLVRHHAVHTIYFLAVEQRRTSIISTGIALTHATVTTRVTARVIPMSPALTTVKLEALE